jgi:hypothetical protein
VTFLTTWGKCLKPFSAYAQIEVGGPLPCTIMPRHSSNTSARARFCLPCPPNRLSQSKVKSYPSSPEQCSAQSLTTIRLCLPIFRERCGNVLSASTWAIASNQTRDVSLRSEQSAHRLPFGMRGCVHQRLTAPITSGREALSEPS